MKKFWEKVCCYLLTVVLISLSIPLDFSKVQAGNEEFKIEFSAERNNMLPTEESSTQKKEETFEEPEEKESSKTVESPVVEKSETAELETGSEIETPEETTDETAEETTDETAEETTDETAEETPEETTDETAEETTDETAEETQEETIKIEFESEEVLTPIYEKSNIYLDNEFKIRLISGKIEDIKTDNITIEKIQNTKDKYTCIVKDGVYKNGLYLQSKSNENLLMLLEKGAVVDAEFDCSTERKIGKDIYNGEETAHQVTIEVTVSGNESGIKSKELYLIGENNTRKKLESGTDYEILSESNKETKVYKFLIGKDSETKEEEEVKLPHNNVNTTAESNNTKIGQVYQVELVTVSGVTYTSDDIVINQRKRELKPGIVYTETKPADNGYYNNSVGEYPIVYIEYPKQGYNDKLPKDYKLEMVCIAEKLNKGKYETHHKFAYDVTNGTTKQEFYTIKEDNSYRIKTYTRDNIGNVSNTYVYTLECDMENPKLDAIEVGGKSILSTEDVITYNNFLKNSVEIVVKCEEGVKINLDVLNAAGDIVKHYEQENSNEKNSFSIDEEGRFHIKLELIDKAGNKTQAHTEGFIIDNEAPGSSKSNQIEMEVKGENENGFINTDFYIELDVKDKPDNKDNNNSSGLHTVDYYIKNSKEVEVQKGNLYTFSVQNPSNDEISRTVILGDEYNKIEISTSDYKEEELIVEVKAVDKSGNESVNTKKIKIDTMSPEVSITFDDNKPLNEKYYNSSRTATISITETFFDPELVEINVTADGVPVNGLIPGKQDWKSDGNVHTAQIVFASDAAYTLSVSCTDLAGNKSDVEKALPFIIDNTQPVAEIVYNNQPYREGYYNAELTATVTITEKNFDEKQFAMQSNQKMSVGKWTHSGDVHRADIIFGQDGKYNYAIDFTDMAGNKIEKFEMQEVILDTILPEITITGVKDGSSNSKDVYPIVNIKDINMDAESVEIKLTNGKGQIIPIENKATIASSSASYELINVSQQEDSVYYIDVISTDIAGNKSEASLRFSLNRNGSTYDFTSVSDIVNRVHNKYSDITDMKLIETNIDKIEEFSIYLNCNGKIINGKQVANRPKIFEEGYLYYSVNQYGSDTLGYTYEYIMYKENFKNEGSYNFTFSSLDRAGNRVNNTSQEKTSNISFIVDDTAPMVYIDGVESGKIYADKELKISAYVTDNIALKEAEFYLVDEAGEQIDSWNYMELAKQEGENIILTLPEGKTKQSLLFMAKDAAGNEVIAKENDNGVPTGFVISSELVQDDTTIEIMPEEVPLSDDIIDTDEGIPGIVYVMIAVAGVLLISATVISKKRKEK